MHTVARMRGARRLALTMALGAGIVLAAGGATASAASQVTLATSPQLSQLIIIGEADEDLIGVSEAGGTITITDQGPGGIATAAPCASANAQTVTCPANPPGAGPILFMAAILQGGNDRFLNQNLSVPLGQYDGGTGDDVIESGDGDDQVQGAAGDDTLLAGGGDDQIGWDTGADEMNGGPGSDSVFMNNAFGPVNVSLDDQPNDGLDGEGDNVSGAEEVEGTVFDDTLTGDDNSNGLVGGPGDDDLTGRGGNDDLSGGDGDDRLNGGASPDGAPDHINCGLGFDLALVDTHDQVEPGCERRGAAVAADSAKLRRKGKVKILVACPLSEGATCAGTLSLLSNGKLLSKNGAFEVGAGTTANGQLKLTRAGRKALRRGGGSLFVTVQAETAEPGGSSITEARLLLTR